MHSECHAEQQPVAELSGPCLRGEVQEGQRRGEILRQGVVDASERTWGQSAVYSSRVSGVS